MNVQSFQVVALRRFRFLPPRVFAGLQQLLVNQRIANFRNPTTFTELLTAKNLSDRNTLLPTTADKYAVRAYVAEKAGDQYLIPLIQCVSSADEINFEVLPKSYVIKATHGCDMTILVSDHAHVDQDKVRKTVAKWLRTDFSRTWKEWLYSQIPPRVVIEEFIQENGQPPADYKFFAFRGDVAMVNVHRNRFANHRIDRFTADWTPILVEGMTRGSDDIPHKPENYDEMLDVVAKLGADFEFARIDLYNVNGRIYFGEITHFPGGGLICFKPREFDNALGAFWRHRTPIPQEFLVSRAE